MASRALTEVVAEFQLCLEGNAEGTDKCHPKKYIEHFYQPLFVAFGDSKVDVLEIGVRHGASMKLWHESNNSGRIVGLDNGSNLHLPRSEWIESERCEYVECDGYSAEVVNMYEDDFDLIIDDGPHSLESQIWAIQNWYTRLSPGGFLVIEDIQGGLHWVDQLIDAVHEDFEGCVRVIDLRKVSGQPDALLVVMHNCTESCSIPFLAINELSFWRSFKRKGRQPLWSARRAGSRLKAKHFPRRSTEMRLN